MGIGRGTLQRAPSHSQSSVKCMKNLFLKFCILTGMLLGLPLLGVYLTGLPLPLYLEFPPFFPVCFCRLQFSYYCRGNLPLVKRGTRMAASEAGEKAFKYSSFPMVGPAWNCNRLDFMDNSMGAFPLVFNLSTLYLCPFMAIFYPGYQCHNLSAQRPLHDG